MVRFIHHSNMISDHWNWASKIKFDSFKNFHLEVTKHGFTHVDAPSHMIKNGKSLDDCKLDLLCGWAKIIDVEECLGDKPITEEVLKSKARNVEKGDIVVLRSNLNDIYPNSSKIYWEMSPYLEDSGSKFLISKGVKSIVFDFPQDRAAKDLQYRVVRNKEFTEHQIVLGAGVMHVEHAIKLNLIKNSEFFLCSLPIKLPKADGGNCTPISIQGIEKKKYEIKDHTKPMVNNDHFNSFLTLSFDKGDQVQETGFSFTGITHTLYISSDSDSFNEMFENLVIHNYDIISNIFDIQQTSSSVIFIDKPDIDYIELSQKIANKNLDILCFSSQPSISEILILQKYVKNIFINIENISQIKRDSYIIFGILKIKNTLISPARVISIS